jgi:hypothetical protein
MSIFFQLWWRVVLSILFAGVGGYVASIALEFIRSPYPFALPFGLVGLATSVAITLSGLYWPWKSVWTQLFEVFQLWDDLDKFQSK